MAGICGDSKQALSEARLAASLGYHAGLLSLGGAMRGKPLDTLLERLLGSARDSSVRLLSSTIRWRGLPSLFVLGAVCSDTQPDCDHDRAV